MRYTQAVKKLIRIDHLQGAAANIKNVYRSWIRHILKYGYHPESCAVCSKIADDLLAE